MSSYNWNFGYWRDGVSLIALVHQFCMVNHLTVSEFIRQFAPRKYRSPDSYERLIELTGLPVVTRDLFGSLVGSAELGKQPFPRTYAVTKRYDEVSKYLRFCPSCLAAGYHFSWQQLVWLEDCPIHEARMVDRCDCSRNRPPYRLSDHSLGPGVLCRCGKYKISRRGRLTSSEDRRRKTFCRELKSLRNGFGSGIELIWVDSCLFESSSPRIAFRISRLVARYLLAIVSMSSSENRNWQTLAGTSRFFNEWRMQSFGRFYDTISRLLEDRDRSYLARGSFSILELNLLGRLEDDVADSRSLADELPMAMRAKTSDDPSVLVDHRLVQGPIRGVYPRNTEGQSALFVMGQTLGWPSAILVRRCVGENNRLECGLHHTGEETSQENQWIDSFARYLVAREFFPNRSSARLSRVM